MQKKQIDCMEIRSIKLRRKSIGEVVLWWVDRAFGAVGDALELIGTACLFGMGFGAGVAIVVALVTL